MGVIPAAYHGPGWRPRFGSLADDVASGEHWTPCGVDSEWGRLRHVTVGMPNRDMPVARDPDAVQHLGAVDFTALRAEIAALANLYRRLGIKVTEIEMPSTGIESRSSVGLNLAYSRDLFAVTQEGVIVGRPASSVRAGEEVLASAALAAAGVPILGTVHGEGTFEGADLLWLNPRLALLGVGNRTNLRGSRQIIRLLAELGVKVVEIKLPSEVQHLLGLVQLVDDDLALLRQELAPPQLRYLLVRAGFSIIEISESEEVTRGQGMNLVTVAPRQVVLPSAVPELASVLMAVGVVVVAEIEIPQLLAGAGGIGCATGVIRRDLIGLPDHTDTEAVLALCPPLILRVPDPSKTAPVFSIKVTLRDGEVQDDCALITAVDSFGCSRIDVTTPRPIQSIAVTMTFPLANFDQVIVPDTGRWFMNSSHPISVWRFSSTLRSRANSLKTPLFIFGGAGGDTELAVGLIAEPHELDMRIIEPTSNRALNVHHRRLTLEFILGTPDSPLQDNLDAGIPVGFWMTTRRPNGTEHWTQSLATFSAEECSLLGIRYTLPAAATQPFWCTWVDWSSDQLDQQRVLENVCRGVELGIKNIIIDDGWFGPGLDSSFDTALNIGDWLPDSRKFPDFDRLIYDIHNCGAAVILWCAPHAIGPAARCFPRHASLLIADEDSRALVSPTQFYSLCFKNPQARAVMVGVVADLVRRYDLDGFKYDLFNWLPEAECASRSHEHDLTSTIVGLQRTLSALREVTDAAPRDMLIELKQDYGTPRFAELGSLMRAGDAPYASYTNLLRTSYIQARGMHALNDYQTFSENDAVGKVAIIGLRMIAAGVPAWGRDLTRLTLEQAHVLGELHCWYQELLKSGAGSRRSHDARGNMILRLTSGLVIFCTDTSQIVDVPPEATQIAIAAPGPTLICRVHGSLTRELSVRSLTGGSTRNLLIEPGGRVSELLVAAGDVVSFAESR